MIPPIFGNQGSLQLISKEFDGLQQPKEVGQGGTYTHKSTTKASAGRNIMGGLPKLPYSTSKNVIQDAIDYTNMSSKMNTNSVNTYSSRSYMKEQIKNEHKPPLQP